jgi:hypothetical protein
MRLHCHLVSITAGEKPPSASLLRANEELLGQLSKALPLRPTIEGIDTPDGGIVPTHSVDLLLDLLDEDPIALWQFIHWKNHACVLELEQELLGRQGTLWEISEESAQMGHLRLRCEGKDSDCLHEIAKKDAHLAGIGSGVLVRPSETRQ